MTSNPIMIVVHPGSACGSADFNLGLEAPSLRDQLAQEISNWPHDILIVDGELSDELQYYATMGIAIANAQDGGKKCVRVKACDMTMEQWPDHVADCFEREWPGGPYKLYLTGAWYHDDGTGCVNAVAEKLSSHDITISDKVLCLL